jgi:hypothetical protein
LNDGRRWKVEPRNDIAYDKTRKRAREVRQPGLVQPTQDNVLSREIG